MESTNEKIKLMAAEIQLTYKTQVKAADRPKITCSRDAYQILRNSWDDAQIEFIEQFKILLMNRANRVLGFFLVSSGCSTATVVDPKIIFTAALKANACCMIASHNHPSGNLSPSQADIDLTRKLKEAGKFLEIQVLDHLIISKDGFYSFADEGLM